ncbi:MAG TPA: PfkB family carbohydrate kinase, partial [Myxococcota bacterium]
MIKVAVVGHVEVVEFIRVPQLPKGGEIAHASELWEEVAGGGAVAAVQLAKLAGASTFFTALGDDERGRAAPARLASFGVRTEAAWRAQPQRRGIVFLDDAAERTITVVGPRHQASADDALPYDELASVDAVYFTAGDLAALQAARCAKVLVANPRGRHALGHGVRLDALVLSA